MFYRAADQRLEDAAFLLEAQRTTAAVYLAGYGVECVLKALILERAGKTRAKEVLDQFRGSGAHNYDWLRFMYHQYGGSTLPKNVTEAFVQVENWGTDLRYKPGTIPEEDADAFLTSARRIWQWADGRL